MEKSNKSKGNYLVIIAFLGCFLIMNSANAQQSSEVTQVFGEIVIEVGVFIFLGSDFQVSYRPEDSPWMYGYRYLKTEDDFFDEAAFGLPGNDSDREIISKSGPFVRYLINPESRETYYLSGALFKSTQRLECDSVTSEDSASSLYFGGGLMGWWNQAISYNVGILMAPGEDLITNTGTCASESEGGFDLSLSLVFRID